MMLRNVKRPSHWNNTKFNTQTLELTWNLFFPITHWTNSNVYDGRCMQALSLQPLHPQCVGLCRYKRPPEEHLAITMWNGRGQRRPLPWILKAILQQHLALNPASSSEAPHSAAWWTGKGKEGTQSMERGVDKGRKSEQRLPSQKCLYISQEKSRVKPYILPFDSKI